LWNNVGKYGTGEQGTICNLTRRMRVACWTNMAGDTHSEYVTIIAFAQ